MEIGLNRSAINGKNMISEKIPFGGNTDTITVTYVYLFGRVVALFRTKSCVTSYTVNEAEKTRSGTAKSRPAGEDAHRTKALTALTFNRNQYLKTSCPQSLGSVVAHCTYLVSRRGY